MIKPQPKLLPKAPEPEPLAHSAADIMNAVQKVNTLPTGKLILIWMTANQVWETDIQTLGEKLGIPLFEADEGEGVLRTVRLNKSRTFGRVQIEPTWMKDYQ